MEPWVVCNFQHICWSRGEIGLTKLDSGRFPFVTRSSWEYQRRKRQEYAFGLHWKRTCYPCVHISLKALKKGLHSASGRTKKIKIKFNLQAVVEDGQQLYVCGSVISLGSWDPELAIPMSPFEGKPDLWQAEIRVSCGTILEYNYFVQRGKIASDDFKWRPGPTFCLKVPSSGESLKKTVVVQDRWCDTACVNIPALSLGASWEDIEVPDQPNGFMGLQSSNVENISAEYSESNVQQVRGQMTSAIRGTISGNIYNVSEEYISPVINAQSQIEDNGISSELLQKGVFSKRGPDFQEHNKNLDGKKIVRQPVEESWLPSGFILLKDESESQNLTPGSELDEVKAITENKGSESRNLAAQIEMDGCATVAEVEEGSERDLKLDNGAHSVERQEKQEGVGIVRNKDVVTEIIINSLVCTTQRIAILEDGKPAEILLEPEETDVQVGSIYLSVVISINHRMGTAFVDIGAKELALLNIKETYPFPSLDLHVKESLSDGDLTNNARVETDLKDEDEEFHELLKIAVQEDEISVPYEYAKDKEEVIDGRLKARGDMGELNKFEMYTNNLSITNVEARDKFSENGHEIHVEKEAKLIVQVIKEGFGKKKPRVTRSPCLNSRFWVLFPGSNTFGVSQKIAGPERKRLTHIAQGLKPSDYGLIVRTGAVGHSYEELYKDLTGLMETWEGIDTCAKSARQAASEGVEDAVPVLLHRATAQTLYVVQNFFNEKVQRVVVDSPHTFHEVTSYLQEFAPSLVSRVELYTGNNLIFDEFGVETEIDNLLCKRVNISNGAYLIIEETEALVSIDVNSGNRFFNGNMSQKKPILEVNIEADILEVNLAAARQIARELRLRDIGGIIVVDFIDMKDEKHKRMVYEEIRKAAQRDRSPIGFSELSELGLMEISRKRVRPSLTYMFSEPCLYCNENGRVEAVNAIFPKIERAIQRLLVKAEDEKSQPRFILWVDPVMYKYLVSGKKTRINRLCTFLKVRIHVELKKKFRQGQFEVQNLKDTPQRVAERIKEKMRIKYEEKQTNMKTHGEISGISNRRKNCF